MSTSSSRPTPAAKRAFSSASSAATSSRGSSLTENIARRSMGISSSRSAAAPAPGRTASGPGWSAFQALLLGPLLLGVQHADEAVVVDALPGAAERDHEVVVTDAQLLHAPDALLEATALGGQLLRQVTLAEQVGTEVDAQLDQGLVVVVVRLCHVLAFAREEWKPAVGMVTEPS